MIVMDKDSLKSILTTAEHRSFLALLDKIDAHIAAIDNGSWAFGASSVREIVDNFWWRDLDDYIEQIMKERK